MIGSLRKKSRDEAAELFKKSQDAPWVTITEAHLAGLPEPVQRYLRYAQVIGKKAVQTIRLKQRGFFRTREGQKWMPLAAEEYYTTQPPAFLWYGSIQPLPLVTVSARDMVSDGHGNLVVKLLSLITLADARGPEVDQGELLRYLSEIVWFPTAWLSDYIAWEAMDARSARVIIHHCGITASGVVRFNERDQLTEFIADRYRPVGREYVPTPWRIPMGGYREIHGVQIPLKGEAIWTLPSGDFSYFRGEITGIEYDRPVPY